MEFLPRVSSEALFLPTLHPDVLTVTLLISRPFSFNRLFLSSEFVPSELDSDLSGISFASGLVDF